MGKYSQYYRQAKLLYMLARDRKFAAEICARTTTALTADPTELTNTAGQGLNGGLLELHRKLNGQPMLAWPMQGPSRLGAAALGLEVGAGGAHSLNDLLPSPYKLTPQLSTDLDMQQLNAAFLSLSKDPLWALAVMFADNSRSSSAGDTTRSGGSTAGSSYDSKSMLQLAGILEEESEEAEEASSSSSSSSYDDVAGLYALASLLDGAASHGSHQ